MRCSSRRITYKTHNEPLAVELWGRNDVGSTWEYLYFLDEVTPQSLATAELNEVLGYQPGARVQGFNILDQSKSGALLGALGLDDLVQPLDALGHLRSLVGTTIPTLTGEPNRIIEVGSEEVLVGTERSPEGQPIPLEWVQTAMDLFTGRRTSLRAVSPSQVFARSGTPPEDKGAGHRPGGNQKAGHAFKIGGRAKARRRVRFPSASATTRSFAKPGASRSEGSSGG